MPFKHGFNDYMALNWLPQMMLASMTLPSPLSLRSSQSLLQRRFPMISCTLVCVCAYRLYCLCLECVSLSACRQTFHAHIFMTENYFTISTYSHFHLKSLQSAMNAYHTVDMWMSSSSASGLSLSASSKCLLTFLITSKVSFLCGALQFTMLHARLQSHTIQHTLTSVKLIIAWENYKDNKNSYTFTAIEDTDTGTVTTRYTQVNPNWNKIVMSEKKRIGKNIGYKSEEKINERMENGPVNEWTNESNEAEKKRKHCSSRSFVLDAMKYV